MARRSAAASAFGGTPRVSCQANCDFLEPDLDGFGRGILQHRGESDRPERCCGATAGPVVDLARRVAGDACEGGLADVGAGEQGGEFGV